MPRRPASVCCCRSRQHQFEVVARELFCRDLADRFRISDTRSITREGTYRTDRHTTYDMSTDETTSRPDVKRGRREESGDLETSTKRAKREKKTSTALIAQSSSSTNVREVGGVRRTSKLMGPTMLLTGHEAGTYPRLLSSPRRPF